MSPSPVSTPPRTGKLTLFFSVLYFCCAFAVVGFVIGRRTAKKPAFAPEPRPADSPMRAGFNDASAGSDRQATPTGTAAVSWTDQKWRRLSGEPGTQARNTELGAMLEKLAQSDPTQAMALAQAEGNLLLRDSLKQAVLRGWAKVSPMDAVKWVYTLPNQSDRSQAMNTVFSAAVATQPDEAIRVAKVMFQQDPAGAVGYGGTLIDALCDAGDFSMATQLASGGDDLQRSSWMGEAYSKWASLQPEQAAEAAAALEDPAARSQALHGVVGGWEDADPAGLTHFLVQLPPSDDRASMIGQSLAQWVKQDPVAASGWINTANLGPDMDQGVAAVATMDSLKPDVAVGWAESIVNEKLRSQTLVSVLGDWARTDYSAAQQYFATTTNLQPEDRKQVASILADLSHNQ